MACNPDPEVLAPMRVMQRPKQKAKQNETKNSQKLCEKRARAQEQRGAKEGFLFHGQELAHSTGTKKRLY
jgi:hypothetical protein